MKTLGKQSSAIFKKIIAQMETETHVKIDNTEGVFMPLVVERIGHNILGEDGMPTVDVYSFAHYFEQNGDLVPDPDMTFAATKDLEFIFPLTYQDQRLYQEAGFVDDGRWRFIPLLQKQLVQFANIWMRNIKNQQKM